MKSAFVAALCTAVLVTFGASSAAQAAMTDFTVAAFDGSITYAPATSLDVSTSLDLDQATLLVSDVRPGDPSGLAMFDPVTLATVSPPGGSVILYGDTTPVPPGGRPLGADVILSWPVIGAPGTDTFTETLTTVESIGRGTPNEITVTLSGTLSDIDGVFKDAPASLMLVATQFLGPGFLPDVTFTNTAGAVVPVIPEPSTWAMMALGFGALGYAAARRRRTNIATLSA
jgi:PEP-CTERM motif